MAKAAKCVSPSVQVGIRELRQNLSVHLARVKRGERLEVTEHGHPVALLVPLPQPAFGLERLIAEGRATRAQADLLALGPPLPRQPGEPSLSEILEELREEERF